MTNGLLTGIYIYPVKSCGSISVSKIHGNQSGLDGDRQWVVLGGGDNVLTQRDYSSMSLIQPTLLDENGYKLKLEAPNMPPIKVEHCEDKDRFCEIDIWDNDRTGYDQGNEVALWLSDYLKTEARLLYTKVGETKDARYVDCSPLLIISEESLGQLNTQVEDPVRMSRFRPSLVVKGLGEFLEDKVSSLKVGETRLNGIKLCGRCVMINIDQENGIMTGSEPLRTLSKYRKEGGKVMFGRYFECDRDFDFSLGMTISAEL